MAEAAPAAAAPPAEETKPAAAPAAAEDDREVTLQTKEGETFKVKRSIAVLSQTIRNMLEDVADSEVPVPLPNVEAPTLRIVLEFCTYHRDHPEAESKFTKGGKVDAFSEWDTQFTNRLKDDQWALFKTLLAANFLDIKPLLEVCCRTVAGMIKGKTPDEICKLFNIRNDPTEEELEQIRKANPWLLDL